MLSEREVLKLLLEPVVEKAREEVQQEERENGKNVVHVSKLTRGCARFKEALKPEDNLENLVTSVMKGETNPVSWLLGQLVHAGIETLVEKVPNSRGCKFIPEKEVKGEFETECASKVLLSGHVDLYVECPEERFAVEIKYRGGLEAGYRSYVQAKIYATVLKVPVYLVTFSPDRVKVEKVEADEEFLSRIVNEFVCQGFVKEIIFNPDARPCNSCALRESCEVWKRTIGVLVSKVLGKRAT